MEENGGHREDAQQLERQQEMAAKNKLGVMPVGRLLANVSLPIMLSMLVQAMYNVVDSIFVAQIGEEALAAVGFVFPIQNLMIAVCVGTGVGVNSLLSRRLGERDVESANRVASNSIFLAFLSWVFFAFAGFLGSRPFITASVGGAGVNTEIAEMAIVYMRIITVGSLGMPMGIISEKLLQGTGRTMYSMVTQMAGAIVNIILDPIMIFGLFGFPAMGVAGAAIATIIGQMCAMVLGLVFNCTKNTDIQLKLRGFRPNPKTIKHIYQMGLPAIVMQSIGSVMVFGINKILVGFGTTPVSVFSVYFKLQSFIFMPVFGLNSGMVPIIAFNYGAKKRERIEKTIRIGITVGLCIMVFGTLLFWLIPGPMLRLFDAQENMMAIGLIALPVISLSFPFAAVSIVLSGVFQALGKGVYSLAMSVVRQLAVLLPLAFGLSRIWGLDAIWFSFPLSECVCIVMAVLFYRTVKTNYISPLGADLRE